jgi:hypothetical protein
VCDLISLTRLRREEEPAHLGEQRRLPTRQWPNKQDRVPSLPPPLFDLLLGLCLPREVGNQQEDEEDIEGEEEPEGVVGRGGEFGRVVGLARGRSGAFVPEIKGFAVE